MSRVRFHGSEAEFNRIFRTRVELLGNSLLLSSPLDRAAELRFLAASRGHHYPETETDIPLHTALPPQNYACYQQHVRALPTLASRVRGGVYIADVDQSMKIGIGSPFFPTLATHGKIIECVSGTLFTAREHLASLGEAVFPDVGDRDFPCMVPHETMSLVALKRISGNAVHLDVLTTLTLYALSSVEVVDFTVDPDGDLSELASPSKAASSTG